VLDLIIDTGVIEAKVCSDRVYHLTIKPNPCSDHDWQRIKHLAAGSVTSVTAFLQGKIPADLMTAITEPDRGLLPSPEAIRPSCDCPQWADLCEHSAAALYGVGVRLDERPELLFKLAGVDPSEIMTSTIKAVTSESAEQQVIDCTDLGDLFGIELE
jgi:uncharacterized Zn finger protein